MRRFAGKTQNNCTICTRPSRSQTQQGLESGTVILNIYTVSIPSIP
ncbi:hypothetical protein ECRN5871_3676 [Escherichia coli RN587/1]|nr:hypothetical protein ECRN5871_3676 [Escherichia coli RN587/1]EII87468.1 hypothetical protein EC3003_2661 [Escherichia coli 3003]